MAIPAHEMVPKKPGRKPGSKSDPYQVLRKVVEVGNMLHIKGMTFTEIYAWNLDPSRAADWGYSLHHMRKMVLQAKRMGAALICKSYSEVLQIAVREYYDLKVKSMEIGDMRVAFLCITQIAKIQEIAAGKASKAVTNPATKSSHFEWAVPGIVDKPPMDLEKAMEDLAGLS